MGQDAEGVWQRTLVTFLKTNNISYAYWSWNQEKSNKILLRSDASTPPPPAAGFIQSNVVVLPSILHLSP